MQLTSDSSNLQPMARWNPWTIAALVFALSLMLCVGALFQYRADRAVAQRVRIRASGPGPCADSAAQRGTATGKQLRARGHGAPGWREDRATSRPPPATCWSAIPVCWGCRCRRVAWCGTWFHCAATRSLIGFDQLNDPGQRKEAIFTRDTGDLTLAGPLQPGAGRRRCGQPPAGVPVRAKAAYAPSGASPMCRSACRTCWGVRRSMTCPTLGVDYQLWRVQADTGTRQMIAASTVPGSGAAGAPEPGGAQRRLESGSGAGGRVEQCARIVAARRGRPAAKSVAGLSGQAAGRATALQGRSRGAGEGANGANAGDAESAQVDRRRDSRSDLRTRPGRYLPQLRCAGGQHIACACRDLAWQVGVRCARSRGGRGHDGSPAVRADRRVLPGRTIRVAAGPGHPVVRIVGGTQTGRVRRASRVLSS